MKKPTPIKYDGTMFFRDQARIIELVHIAAKEANVRPSQYVRSAVQMALQMSGFNIGGGK